MKKMTVPMNVLQLRAAWFIVLTAFVLSAVLAATAVATPLDDYVAKPDPAFKYELVNQGEKPDSTTYVYHMVFARPHWLSPRWIVPFGNTRFW